MHHHPPMLFFSKAQVDYSFGWSAECWPQKDKNVNIRLFGEGRLTDKCKAYNKVILEEVWTRRKPKKIHHFLCVSTSLPPGWEPVFTVEYAGLFWSRSTLSDADFRASGYSTGDEHMYIYCFLSLMNALISTGLQAHLWGYKKMLILSLPHYGLQFPSCMREVQLMRRIQSLVPVWSTLLIWLDYKHSCRSCWHGHYAKK